MTWENYFDREMKKVISTNNLIALNSLKNKAQTLFGLHISIYELRRKLEKTGFFFEVKSGFFVCKNYLEKITSGDEKTLKERLENEYFINFEIEDLDRITSKKHVDKKEKIYADLNVYEKLAIYICARSPRHFIKRYRECFNNRYSNFIMGKKIYENGTVSSEAVEISMEIEKRLISEIGQTKFLKWVTLPKIKLEELWTDLDRNINKELVLELVGIIEKDKKNPRGQAQEEKKIQSTETVGDTTINKPVKALEELTTKNLSYSEDELVVSVIKWIFKNKSPLRLNVLDTISKFNCSCTRLLSILGKNRKLFYFATRKTIHFKPYIAGALVDEFYGEKLSKLKLEKKMTELFERKTINRAALANFLLEYKEVFRWREDRLEILINSEKYIEYIKSKYSTESLKTLEKFLSGNIGIEKASEELKISIEELANILNKRKDIFVKNGVTEKITEETNEIKLEKIMLWFEYIDRKYKGGFDNHKLGIILSRIVKRTPLDADEIYKRLWLFQDRISKSQIEKILEENNAFKMVDFERYVSSDCVIHNEFKNNFNAELENVLSILKDTEKKVLEKRIISKITLEELGKEMKLTRERVRQIEKKTLEKIQNSKSKNLIPYLNIIENILNKTKVIEIAELEKKLNFYNAFRSVEIRYLLSIFEIFTGIEICFYFDKYVSIISREELLEKFQEFLDQPIKFKEFVYELEKKGIKNKEFLKDYIRESDQAEVYKDFILIKGGKVNTGDRIRLIFYDEGRELKISEILTLYEDQYGNGMSDRNVQTKLGHYENLFTRVFTGTYSLVEWGAEKHINSIDLIEEYLEKIKKPVSYQEILDNVMSRTRAKEETIRIFLASSKKTFAYSHGEWALIKWKDDPKMSKRYYISENRIQASYSGLTHTQHKGYLEKNGRKVSLHMAGGPYLKHSGSINLGAGVLDQDEMDICIYVKDKSFEFTTYRSSKHSIYGVREMLDYAGIGEGDYFYLEYWPDGNIKLYTWDEFESYSESGEFPKKQWEEKGENKKPEKTQEISEPIGVYKSGFTFDEILSHGLATGMVETEMLSKIDYSKEKIIKDVYEAIEVLEERGVIVPM